MTLLTGEIRTSNNTPMQWVAVILNPATEYELITLTNSKGQFAFKVPPKEYEIAVRTFAFQPYSDVITVPISGKHLTIKLNTTLRSWLPA